MFRFFLALLILGLASLPAAAQMRGKRLGGGMVEARAAFIEATGLKPAFPEGLVCEPISSPYGSATRFDGSARRTDRYGGLHGGMDLSLNEGTPLLAVAAAEVIAKGEGGLLEGIFLWLRIAPEDSGLPFWTFVKYQHLSEMPTLETGARVMPGQVVARSGSTGTAGGHYGAAGYPHLHLSTHYGPSGEFTVTGMFASLVKGTGAELGDPMRLYLAAGEAQPGPVPVPAMRSDGVIVPAGSRVVWPVSCAPAAGP